MPKAPSCWETIGFDIESDGLLDTISKIHMIHLIDMETGEVRRFDNRTGEDYTEINQAISIMQKAKCLVGHNVINYDIPAIWKFYPDFKVQKGYQTYSAKHTTKGFPQVYDTIVVSKVQYSDMSLADFSRFRKCRLGTLAGKHSLKAWGYRLGTLKGDFSNDDTDWSHWTQSMSDYCEQDVKVTRALYLYFEGLSSRIPQECFELEHDTAWILQRQETMGYLFDHEKAERLYAEVAAEFHDYNVELVKEIPPWEDWFTPKRNNKTKGYIEGVPTIRKLIPFKPTSRTQIIRLFKEKYKWKPEVFTKKGQPKVDDKVLNDLPFPEAEKLARLFFLKKLMGQLNDGDNGWLKCIDEKTGRIHCSVNTNGAVTGRMTHSKPNLAQVPSTKKEFGTTCRECFCVPPGRKQIGIDASGLELRLLSHYLYRWDKGAYAREILEGDIHTANQQAAGLPTRDDAKTFIYAFCYGAGDGKLGSIIGAGAAKGRNLRETFLCKIPALGKLTKAIKSRVAERNALRGLDGRTIPIRSDHAALNSLLQGAGAVVMKRALVILDYKIQEQGLKSYTEYGTDGDFEFVANVHDEWQIEAEEKHAELIGKLGCEAITEAGQTFNLNVRLDGEAKVGNNWADCH